MKVLKITIFVILLSVSIFSSAEKRSAVFEMTDGTTAIYKLSESPKLTFSGDNVNVSTSNASATYLRANVKKVYFSETSGVDQQLQSNQILINLVDNNVISLNGLSKGDKIAVFGVDGKLMKSVTSDGLSEQVDLSNLSAGVYMVTVNGAHTFKFNHK